MSVKPWSSEEEKTLIEYANDHAVTMNDMEIIQNVAKKINRTPREVTFRFYEMKHLGFIQPSKVKSEDFEGLYENLSEDKKDKITDVLNDLNEVYKQE